MSDNNDNASNSKTRQAGNSEHYRRKRAIQRKRRRNQRNVLMVSAFAGVVIVAILLILLIPGKKNELLGVWQYDQYTQYEFSNDGEGCLCVDDVHYEYKYKISGDTLKLDFVEDIVRDCEYSFAIDGNTLTLIGGEGTDGGTYSLNKITKQ